MNDDNVSLKEGYWVRIGDESYAIHRILSVSVVDPSEDDGFLLMFPALGTVGLGIFLGVKAESWIVGIVAVVALFLGVFYFIGNHDEKKKIRLGYPRNVVLQLDKKGPRVVALMIPKAEAEQMQRKIEAIVAVSAKSGGDQSGD